MEVVSVHTATTDIRVMAKAATTDPATVAGTVATDRTVTVIAATDMAMDTAAMAIEVMATAAIVRVAMGTPATDIHTEVTGMADPATAGKGVAKSHWYNETAFRLTRTTASRN